MEEEQLMDHINGSISLPTTSLSAGIDDDDLDSCTGSHDD